MFLYFSNNISLLSILKILYFMWVVIHMCIETMLEIFLYSYFYVKLAKMVCFSNSFLCILFNKIREQVGRTGSSRKLGVGGLRGEETQIMYTHVSKCKNDKIKEKKKRKTSLFYLTSFKISLCFCHSSKK
jgi:hypothetical protein